MSSLAEMKALVLTGPGHFEYADVPVAEPADDEVLVAVRACGICGSDVHGMDGSSGRRRPPVVMGHEAAGVVARVGAGVQGWAEGDRVTFDSTVSCGRCQFCRQGQANLCDERRVLGVSCDEYRRDGAFADYVAVPARILYGLPDSLSFEHAALLETLSVAVHAVRRVGVSPGETAVVVGTGMVGVLVVQALRAYGCDRVIGVDLDAGRLALAEKFGAVTVSGDAQTVAAGRPRKDRWCRGRPGHRGRRCSPGGPHRYSLGPQGRPRRAHRQHLAHGRARLAGGRHRASWSCTARVPLRGSTPRPLRCLSRARSTSVR